MKYEEETAVMSPRVAACTEEMAGEVTFVLLLIMVVST